ncbi:NAD-dependent epimerase/dehydratase family protein [Mucilaginibacter litoreus]|uniref:NAD-dependent epimerase/dehydratase family protein n=1 Tax=Mucilaginibacter litoreus TaxID=1048221 RepID=A0ABW3AP01_9SPHI
MMKTRATRILVTGAAGQLGTELANALRERHGNAAVIATDIRGGNPLNVMDKIALHRMVIDEGITEIYHLAAMLSASGEQSPLVAWDLNMQGLINVLEIAKAHALRVFWPSSIAVFGAHIDRTFTRQFSILEPATVYGISKASGELWCKYYFEKYGVDVRSLRYPGLISYSAPPGGGTTDYAVDIFLHAAKGEVYTCFLKPMTTLPMLYMPDAVRATLELMSAPADTLTVRTSYNLQGVSVRPLEFEAHIRARLPNFRVNYLADFRQRIADTWPQGLDDGYARRDWGWKPQFDLPSIVEDMLKNLLKSEPEKK